MDMRNRPLAAPCGLYCGVQETALYRRAKSGWETVESD